MSPPIGHLRHLLAGRVAPLSRFGTTSAIDKAPVSDPVIVSPLGLEGDEQDDHYNAWRDDLGPHPRLDRPGAIGENLAVSGLTEDDVCLGDRWRVGEQVLLEVTQGRQPCWKLADRFGVPDMVPRVQTTLRTGWYARVLAPGRLAVGDTLTFVDRSHPAWTIRRVTNLLYAPAPNIGDLATAPALPLPEGWRRKLAQRLGWDSPLAPNNDALRTHGPAVR